MAVTSVSRSELRARLMKPSAASRSLIRTAARARRPKISLRVHRSPVVSLRSMARANAMAASFIPVLVKQHARQMAQRGDVVLDSPLVRGGGEELPMDSLAGVEVAHYGEPVS